MIVEDVRSYFKAKKRKYWKDLNEALDRLFRYQQTKDDLRVILSGLEAESDWAASCPASSWRGRRRRSAGWKIVHLARALTSLALRLPLIETAGAGIVLLYRPKTVPQTGGAILLTETHQQSVDTSC